MLPDNIKQFSAAKIQYHFKILNGDSSTYSQQSKLNNTEWEIRLKYLTAIFCNNMDPQNLIILGGNYDIGKTKSNQNVKMWWANVLQVLVCYITQDVQSKQT